MSKHIQTNWFLLRPIFYGPDFGVSGVGRLGACLTKPPIPLPGPGDPKNLVLWGGRDLGVGLGGWGPLPDFPIVDPLLVPWMVWCGVGYGG